MKQNQVKSLHEAKCAVRDVNFLCATPVMAMKMLTSTNLFNITMQKKSIAASKMCC